MLNKQILTLALTLLIALSIEACTANQVLTPAQQVQGSGSVTRESRPLAGFQKVSLNGMGTAVIRIGETEEVAIEAEDELLPYIETRVQDGTLSIATRANTSLKVTQPIRYEIQVRALSAVELNGAMRVQISTPLDSASFRAAVGGASVLEIAALHTPVLQVRCDGAGSVRIGGTAERLTLALNGTGSLNAADLESSAAEVKVNGTGAATLWVHDSLTAQALSQGKVRYYGAPTLTSPANPADKIIALGNK
jgi:hypothetical protein